MDHLEYHQLALVTQQKYRRERQSLLRKDKFSFSNDIPSIRFRNTLRYLFDFPGSTLPKYRRSINGRKKSTLAQRVFNFGRMPLYLQALPAAVLGVIRL